MITTSRRTRNKVMLIVAFKKGVEFMFGRRLIGCKSMGKHLLFQRVFWKWHLNYECGRKLASEGSGISCQELMVPNNIIRLPLVKIKK